MDSDQTDPRPTHLLSRGGDRKVMCGLDADHAHPRVHVRHAPDHVRGYGMRVCADCVATLGILADPILLDAATPTTDKEQPTP